MHQPARAADQPPLPQRAGAMANGTLRDPAAVAPPFATPTVQRVVAGVLMPLVAVVVAAIGLHARAAGGISALDAVAAGLVLAWALAGAVATRPRDRAPQWQVASGALAASVALAAARLAGQAGGQHEAARAVATIAGPLVIAISFHLLLALPDGRLAGRARWIAAALGYALAAGSGLALSIAGRPFPVTAGALIWSLAVLCALPGTRLRYTGAAQRDRERLRWLGIGVTLAADAT